MEMDKKQSGFTLIEMMIVLLVISVLLIITIPNVAKNNSTINNKGSEAFLRMVEGQVQAYEMEHNKIPDVNELVKEGYLKANEVKCPNGKPIKINEDGTVSLSEGEGT